MAENQSEAPAAEAGISSSAERKQVERRYEYFVAYSYEGGVASTGVTLKSPITTMGEVAQIEAAIVQQNPSRRQVVVTNWRRFDQPE